ncbi:MAG: hypothetical protein JST90_08785 [Bacteroidetes bacterium]|nr:hypothetical protein [Bacteroidota bacterium]
MKSFLKNSWATHKYAIILMSLFTLGILILALCTHGTADEGDSVNHYLFARYAIKYPFHFFHHWAKPFFVLLAFPFAQAGFMGVKLMNVACTCITVWFSYLIAHKLAYRWALSVFVIATFFKLLLIVGLSGLTEPLHAALLAIAIYLVTIRRFAWATVIISFLPLVRSEGICICGVFAVYLILTAQWRYIPLLAVGHLAYGIVGYPRFHDLLWVIHNIPYHTGDQHYGHGDWSYYLIQMPGITGFVNSLLLAIGLIYTLYGIIRSLLRGAFSSALANKWMIATLFCAFFAMHTIFWALGLYGSFGLVRVFIAVASPMILLMVGGIEALTAFTVRIPFRNFAIAGGLLISSLVLAAGHTQYAYYPDMDFGLHPDQLCDKDAADYIKKNIQDYRDYDFFFDTAYLAELLDVDIFGDPHFANNDHLPSGGYPHHSIIIWDDFYSDFEHGVHLVTLRKTPDLKELKTFQHENPWGGTRTVVVFVKD